MTLAQDPFHFSGEDSSPDGHPYSSYDLDDDFLREDSKDHLTLLEQPAAPKKKSNGRKGPENVDKRATHNAIERARRESLNGRFTTLAEALPSMSKVKRPSKSVIVTKALEFVYDAQVKEHALIKENNELRREVDQLRARLGLAPLPPPAPLSGSAPAPAPASVPTSHGIELSMVQQQQQEIKPVLSAHSPSLPSPPSTIAEAESPVLAHHQHQQGMVGSHGSSGLVESPATAPSPNESLLSGESRHTGSASNSATPAFVAQDPFNSAAYHPQFPQMGHMMQQQQQQPGTPSTSPPPTASAYNPAALQQQTLLLAAHLQHQRAQYQHQQALQQVAFQGAYHHPGLHLGVGAPWEPAHFAAAAAPGGFNTAHHPMMGDIEGLLAGSAAFNHV